jgi:hypothetical protein
MRGALAYGRHSDSLHQQNRVNANPDQLFDWSPSVQCMIVVSLINAKNKTIEDSIYFINTYSQNLQSSFISMQYFY